MCTSDVELTLPTLLSIMDVCELDDHKIRVLRSDEWCGKEFVWPIEHSNEIERCRSMGKSYGMDANGKHLIHMCDVDTELRCSESDVSVVCPKMGESVGDGLGSALVMVLDLLVMVLDLLVTMRVLL